MTLTGIECLWKVFFEVCDNLMRTNFKAKFVGNKAKRRISKWVFSRKQSTPNFSKNEDFLPPPPPPLIRTRTCVNQGVRNARFLENLACFFILKHPFWDLPFCLITSKFSLHFYLKIVRKIKTCLEKNWHKNNVLIIWNK